MKVRCGFYLRTPVVGGYRYDMMWLKGWHQDGFFHTEHPPLIGDRIALSPQDPKQFGTYRVVDREVQPVQYGSVAWPVTKTEPDFADMMTLIVVPVPGLFVDEVEEETPAEEE